MTQQASSPVLEVADETFVVAADGTVQFGNTVFEHVALLVLDSVVLALISELDEPMALVKHHHTNLQ